MYIYIYIYMYTCVLVCVPDDASQLWELHDRDETWLRTSQAST